MVEYNPAGHSDPASQCSSNTSLQHYPSVHLHTLLILTYCDILSHYHFSAFIGIAFFFSPDAVLGLGEPVPTSHLMPC